MSETYIVDSNLYMPPAFAGQLADLQFTSKETYPCGTNAVGMGLCVTPASDGKVQIGGTGVGGGIAIHDHTLAGIYNASEYRRYDAVSVIRRGRIWAKASGACTKGAAAKFSATTGLFGNAEANTLANARFVTANISVAGMPGDSAVSLVLVELHDPAIDNIGAS